jgi:hypothetical protein
MKNPGRQSQGMGRNARGMGVNLVAALGCRLGWLWGVGCCCRTISPLVSCRFVDGFW